MHVPAASLPSIIVIPSAARIQVFYVALFFGNCCIKTGLFGVKILCLGFSCTPVEVFQVTYATVYN